MNKLVNKNVLVAMRFIPMIFWKPQKKHLKSQIFGGKYYNRKYGEKSTRRCY